MKKSYILAFFAVIVGIGCSALFTPLNVTPTPQSSPTPQPTLTPQPTPTPQVIYKSPAEMNLRPGDISGLRAEKVENPSTELLLPEADDQNQRAFTDEAVGVKVETNIILLPERTHRTIADVYDIVVPKRRPAAKQISEESVNVGEEAVLFETTDDCGTGFVLITLRSNIIVVIIGCGSEMTPVYMKNIGHKIDRHVTGSTTECSQLGLTESECTNSGIHQYSQSWTTSDPNSCGIPEPTPLTFLIIFSENDFYINLSDSGWLNQSDYFSKTSPNIYSSIDKTSNGEDWHFEFTFNDYGFVLKEQIGSCYWTATFQQIK